MSGSPHCLMVLEYICIRQDPLHSELVLPEQNQHQGPKIVEAVPPSLPGPQPRSDDEGDVGGGGEEPVLTHQQLWARHLSVSSLTQQMVTKELEKFKS